MRKSPEIRSRTSPQQVERRLGIKTSQVIIIAPLGLKRAFLRFMNYPNVIFIADDENLTQKLKSEIEKSNKFRSVVVIFTNKQTHKIWEHNLETRLTKKPRISTLCISEPILSNVNFPQLKQQVNLLVGENVKYGSVSNTFKHN